jgi:putative oxidoreductase
MPSSSFSCNKENAIAFASQPFEVFIMIDLRTAGYGLAFLRIALGVMFVAHAALKYFVFTMPGFAGFLGQIGMPTILAWPITLAEFFGGLMLIAGVQARLVSIALLPIMAGAVMVHLPNGWVFNAPNGGWEYPAFLIVAQVTHILAGDGAMALKPSSLPLTGQTVRLAAAE